MNLPIGQQLLAVQAESNRGRPEVRPIVQVTSALPGVSAAEATAAARKVILSWLSDKQRISAIPKDAWDGASFEIDATQDRPISVESLDAIWAMRYDNPDASVNGRIWRTEAIIGAQDNLALVGVRLTTITREWDIQVMRSVPRVVHDLAKSPGLIDYGVSLTATPTRIETPEDAARLVSLLEEPRRSRPVFVVAEDRDGATLVDVNQLASRTTGLAHVCSISYAAARALSEVLGSSLSVFGQAVRTYHPGFRRSEALFEEHPLATAAWLSRRFPDPKAFVSMLANQSIDASVSTGGLEERLPAFGRVRTWAAARRLEKARLEIGNEAERLRLAEQKIVGLEDDLEAAESLYKEEYKRNEQLVVERDEEKRAVRRLRARIAYLEAALEQPGVAEPLEYPQSYDELEDWVNRHLGDRLTLLARAARAIKKAEFADVRLVCDALILLAGPYRDMRCGLPEGRYKFEKERAALSVEISPTGDRTSLLQWREEYVVRWNGERQFLDMHLKKGTSREPRNCLRVYFFWDDDTEQVIVGYLPGHLTTGAS